MCAKLHAYCACKSCLDLSRLGMLSVIWKNSLALV